MNRPDPLTPEERELARLLGRPASSAPSSSVDAAVLAAARAAVQTAGAGPAADAPAAAPPLRRRSRVPAALGLAASLVFAVGIAWQLKPESPPPAAPVPVAAEVTGDSSAAASADAAPDTAAARRQAPAEAAAPDTPPAPARAAAAPRQPSTAPVPPVPSAPPAPMAAPAALPPPPPAPMAAPSLQSPAEEIAQAPTLDSAKVSGSQSTGSQERSARRAPGVMRRAAPVPATAQGALVSSDALSLAVDADAALPRRQWIKRIRERRDAGDLDTARASLERYLEHYPEARIPRDLRQLLDP